MTLPVPADTGRLADTDIWIRRLAESVDAKLVAPSKVFATVNAQYTANAQGNIVIQFPLSIVAGAVILPKAKGTVQGQVDTLPPVPPSSIGRILPFTPYLIYPWWLNPAPGQVYAAARTPAVNMSPTSNGTPQWYGSQPVKNGTQIGVVGIAWGTP